MTPAIHQPSARDSERPAWRKRLEEQIGEDPGRVLDVELKGPHAVGDEPLLTAKARIRGIDRIAVVRAYMAAERRLGRGPDGGPRTGTMMLLERREEFLRMRGERPEDLEAARADPETDVPSRYARREVRDVEHRPLRRVDEDGREYKLVQKYGGNAIRYVDESPAPAAAATDGGEPS